jgi:hypothetical protein
MLNYHDQTATAEPWEPRALFAFGDGRISNLAGQILFAVICAGMA